jgi:D-alanyl-D-alanine carboxypeptidase/D-alanyl-D-alanine-endopeptidase (penicillin-binding protein 4)
MNKVILLLVTCLCTFNGNCQQRGILAFAAMDLRSGDMLYDHNANIPMVPASIHKVIVSYTAYKRLKPNYQFKTIIGIEGEVDDSGLLNGDLVVIGGGDPSLGSKYSQKNTEEVLLDIVASISKNGVTCIDGSIVIDASVFGTFCHAPTWPLYDLGNYYACGAWGLNIGDNANELVFQLSDDTDIAPGLTTYWGESGLNYINELTTGAKGSGDNAYIYGGPFQLQRHIRGTLPQSNNIMTIRGSLTEPPRFFAERLQAALLDHGIQSNAVEVRYELSDWSDLTVIQRIVSPPLSELLKTVLRKSDNLTSEAIFRMLSKSSTYNEAVSNFNSLSSEYLKDTECFIAKDGCGLSPFNRVCVSEMVKNLREIYLEAPEFIELLASMEQTSLKSFSNLSDAHVKSGYMEGVCAYSGVYKDRFAFCTVYNGKDYQNKAIKKKMAELLEEVVNY